MSSEKMRQCYGMIHQTEGDIREAILAGDPNYAHHPPIVTVKVAGKVERRVEAVYVTSLDNIDRNVTAGATCGVRLKHGATLIIERTHRLATAEEVAAMFQHQRDQKAMNDAEDAKNANRFHVALPGGGSRK